MRIMLGNIMAIYQKELQGYFVSPLAYLVGGAFWFLSGLFFVIILSNTIQQATAFDLQREQFGGSLAPPIDVPALVLQSFLNVVASLVLFILPILSMGLYAEERKRGTLELLATSPVTNWAVAVGKLLGVLTFVVTLILPMLVYEAIAFSAADPPFQPVVMLVAHGGLILLAASVLSLGMFISSLTESSLLAAVYTFGLVLFLWVLDAVSAGVSGPVGAVLRHLSLVNHFDNLARGLVDSGSLILFASYIILGVFLTAQSIEALRFQRS